MIKINQFRKILEAHGIILGASHEDPTGQTNLWGWCQKATNEFENDFSTADDAYIAAAKYVLETEGDELPALDEDGELILPVEPITPAAKKTFLASWGGSFANPGVRQVAGDFFCEGNCYDENDIERIAELEVGDVWTSRHYGDHVVIRLADDVVVSVFIGVTTALPVAILEVNDGQINCVRSSVPMRIIILNEDTEDCDEDDLRKINTEMVHVRDCTLIKQAAPGFDGVNVEFVDQIITHL